MSDFVTTSLNSSSPKKRCQESNSLLTGRRVRHWQLLPRGEEPRPER